MTFVAVSEFKLAFTLLQILAAVAEEMVEAEEASKPVSKKARSSSAGKAAARTSALPLEIEIELPLAKSKAVKPAKPAKAAKPAAASGKKVPSKSAAKGVSHD
jgi:hypothetical protein